MIPCCYKSAKFKTISLYGLHLSESLSKVHRHVFPPFLQRGTIFVDSHLLPRLTKFFPKGTALKENKLFLMTEL